MNKIEKIIVHCSASDFGNAEIIDRWHREKGYKSIGYHWVIMNGKPKPNQWNSQLDGALDEGRGEDNRGAHCKGQNKNSVGICLIGNPKKQGDMVYTDKQMDELRKLIHTILLKEQDMDIPVYGHNDFSSRICPGFDVKAWWVLVKRDQSGVYV